jgi:hypothetical protein
MQSPICIIIAWYTPSTRTFANRMKKVTLDEKNQEIYLYPDFITNSYSESGT